MPVPKPVPTRVVCSVCGLDWERHGEKPGYEICIKLLKADLAKKPTGGYLVSTGGAPNAAWQVRGTGI